MFVQFGFGQPGPNVYSIWLGETMIRMSWDATGLPNPTKKLGMQTQGLLNVPIEHHPTFGDIISNKYIKVMFKIPKKGHLPTPETQQV